MERAILRAFENEAEGLAFLVILTKEEQETLARLITTYGQSPDDAPLEGDEAVRVCRCTDECKSVQGSGNTCTICSVCSIRQHNSYHCRKARESYEKEFAIYCQKMEEHSRCTRNSRKSRKRKRRLGQEIAQLKKELGFGL